jgi:hypothetical protein
MISIATMVRFVAIISADLTPFSASKPDPASELPSD